MPGTTEKPFAIARRTTFDALRDLLEKDMDRFARVVLGDCFPDLRDKILCERLCLIFSVEAMALKEMLSFVIDRLQAGETVYQLTGRPTLPTYRRISSGDEAAGKLSAIEDFRVMIYALDTGALVKAAQRRASWVKNEDRNVGYFDQPFSANFESALWETYCMLTDGYLARTEPLWHAAGAPEMIGYEGKLADPPPFRTPAQKAIGALRDIEDITGRMARRAAKIPASWPPLSGAAAPQNNPSVRSAGPLSPPRRATPNPDPDFVAAYRQTITKLHDGLQAAHFESLRGRRDYALQARLPLSWEKIVAAKAERSFSDHIRDPLRDALQAPVLYEGQGREAGRAAALAEALALTARVMPVDCVPGSMDYRIYAALIGLWSDGAKILATPPRPTPPPPPTGLPPPGPRP